jgi:large repetitive protein
MVEKVLKQPRKNKYLLGIATGFILLLFVLLFNSNVLSLGGTKQIIEFNDQEWDMNGQGEQPDWYTKSKESISFTVNLTEDYSQLTEEEKAAATTPFAVSAGYEGAEKNFVKSISETSTKGIFKVDVTLPKNPENAKIEVEVGFVEENNWGINTGTETFSIIADYTVPKISHVNLSVEEGVISTQDVTLSAEVTDEHLNLDDVTLAFTKGTEENVVAKVEDGINVFTFKNDGEYELTVQATDKAGNTETSKPVSFFINKTGKTPEITVNSAENNFIKSKDVTFEISSLFTITKARIEVDGQPLIEEPILNENNQFRSIFQDEGVHSVNAIITDATGREYELSKQITVDTKEPTVSVTRNNSGVVVTEETITIVVDEHNFDPAKVFVTLNGEPKTYSEDQWNELNEGNGHELRLPLTENGTYNVSVKAKDMAGNQVAKTLDPFTLDTEGPKLSISEMKPYANEPKDVTLTVEDNTFDPAKTKVQIKKDGTVLTKADSEEDLFTGTDFVREGNQATLVLRNLTEDGKYEVNLSSTDQAGNAAEQKSVAFTIDTINPVLSIEGVEGTGGEIGYYQETSAVLTLTDANFNKENTEVDVTFKDEDKTATFTGKDFKESGNGTYTLELPFADSSSDSVLGSLLDAKADSIRNLLTGEGEYQITFNSTDKAGNSTEKEPVSFIIDRSPASITFTGTTKTGSEEQNFNEKDFIQNAKVKMDIVERNFLSNVVHYEIQKKNEAGQFESVEGPVEWKTVGRNSDKELSFTEDGTYLLIVTATDKAENPVTEQFEFTVDNTDPIIHFSDIAEQAYSENGTLSVSVDEQNYATNTVKLTKKVLTTAGSEKTADWKTSDSIEQAWEDVTKPFTFNFTEDGIFIFDVTVTDKAGNTKTETITHTIDNQGAIISILDASKSTNLLANNSNHYGEDVTIKVAVDDLTLDSNTTNLTIEKRNDANKTEWTKVKSDVQLTIAESGLTALLDSEVFDEGTYRITVETTDLLGHDYTKTIEFTIDKTAPEINLSGINQLKESIKNDDFIQNGEVTITVDELNHENNDYQVTIKANRKDLNGETKSYDLGTLNEQAAEVSKLPHIFNEEKTDAKDGYYTIEVSAVDKAGNNAETKTLAFTVDNIAPVAKINGVKKDFYNKVDNEVNLSVSVDEYNYSNNDVEVTVAKGDKGKPGEPINLEWTNVGKVTERSYPAFTDEGEYVFTVKTEDKAGNVGVMQTSSFIIDKTLPVLSISDSVKKENNHYNYNINNVLFKVVDKYLVVNNTNLTITRDGKALSGTVLKELDESTAEYKYDFDTEGKYVLNFHSTDKAGNRTDHETIDFVLDKTMPVVEIAGIENNSYNPTAKKVTVSVDELNNSTNTVEFKVTKDGVDITDQVEGSTSSWRNRGKVSELSYNFAEDGFYTIFITATDKAGNKAVSQQKSFTIDKVKPAIDITGVDEGTHYNVDKPVGITITDVNLDVNNVTVTKNGANYNIGKFSITTNRYENSTAKLSHNFSQEGEYKILVEAVDQAGNSFNRSISFTIDKTKPVITPKMKGSNTVIKDGSFINTVFTPMFALDEAEDTLVSVSLNGGPNIAKGIPVASQEIAYKYDVLARDKAGNETTLTVSFTLDTTTPKLSITGVLDGFFNGDIKPTVTYSDKHLDEAKTFVTLNGQPFKNGTVLERETDYELKAVITDFANNVSTRTIVFRIDKTAPVIKFKEPISGRYFKEDLIPKLLIEDLSAYDIIAVTLDGNEYTLGDSITGEGKHVLFFEVKDKAGNIQQLSVEFILDKTPPKVVFDGVKANKKYYNSVSISIRLDNIADKIKQITLNGKEFTGTVSEEDGYTVIKTNLSDIRSYKFEVVAYDEAGNEVSTTLPFEIAEKSLFVKFYENKPVFLGSSLGLVGLLFAVVTIAIRRKKKVVQIED